LWNRFPDRSVKNTLRTNWLRWLNWTQKDYINIKTLILLLVIDY
jgi:hypothetical protein